MTASEISGTTLNDYGVLYKLVEKPDLDTELDNLVTLLDKQSFI